MSFHEEMARRQKSPCKRGKIMDDEKQSITSPRI